MDPIAELADQIATASVPTNNDSVGQIVASIESLINNINISDNEREIMAACMSKIEEIYASNLYHQHENITDDDRKAIARCLGHMRPILLRVRENKP